MRESDFIFYADPEQADFKLICDWELSMQSSGDEPLYPDAVEIIVEEGEEEAKVIDPENLRIASRLLAFANEFGLSGNLWQQWIAYLVISDENPFSLACEMRKIYKSSTMTKLAKHDFELIYELFNEGPPNAAFMRIGNFMKIFGNYKAAYKGIEASAAGRKIKALADELAKANDAYEFLNAVTAYYEMHGAGNYGLYKTFRVNVETDGSFMEIIPIKEDSKVNFDVLVGFDDQKEALKANTEAFLNGKPANNVLLYGDSGTGKSTSVHALINEYADEGLRIVELGKSARSVLPQIISELKSRNYKFIIYMDDLSFEEDESEYKELKAMLEGALESVNENVLIYATSNRRHLIRETWRDRSDMEFEQDVHRSDTMEEKLSLAGRFGLSIYYPRSNYQEYLDIVKALAKREKLKIGEAALEDEARKWSIRYGSTSGRTASQLIKWLAS